MEKFLSLLQRVTNAASATSRVASAFHSSILAEKNNADSTTDSCSTCFDNNSCF